MTTLKCATWNVNSLRVRLPHVLRWWDEAQPDVLLLQETKTENLSFPQDALAGHGLHMAFHGQKSYNGVAILSRHPLTDVRPGFNGADLEGQARYLAATVQAGGVPVRVASVYVPNGEALSSPKFAFKEAFYKALETQVLQDCHNSPRFLLGGDFNIAADERDVPNPEKAAKDVLFTPQERGWLAGLQARTGLSDALRLVSQDAGVYSWWDYRTYGRTPANGMRIDYLFASPALHSAVSAVTHSAAERAQPQPSDHVPVMATLVFP